MTVVRLLVSVGVILWGAEWCAADDFKPPIAPGLYHIRFRISDAEMSRVIEIRDLRQDRAFTEGGFMEVTWVGMWPEQPNTFMRVEKQNQMRTTGVFSPKTIKMIIPDIRTAREIDVYYFTLEAKPDKHGTYKGTGDVPYTGPNGVGKNQFTCEMEPLPTFKFSEEKGLEKKAE